MEPRNTLLTVIEIEQKETTTSAGLIRPAATNPEFKPCKIIKVGPGQISTKDDISTMLDLKPGQLVLVKLAIKHRIDKHTAQLESIGIDFKDVSTGQDLKLVEQTMVVGIIAEPGEWEEDTEKIKLKLAGPIVEP